MSGHTGSEKAKLSSLLGWRSARFIHASNRFSTLDFSVPGSLPWNLLIERIREIEADATSKEDLAAAASVVPSQQDPRAKAILSYLNQRGYQMVSCDRIRRRIDPALTDKDLDALVDSNSTGCFGTPF